MRVMRAEPNRFTDRTTKSVGAVWRAYDLQLTVYVVLLGAIGLVMAYTNSVEAGESVLRSGTTFTHCGTDAVSLIRAGGAWKIVSFIWTVRRERCTHLE